MNQPNGQKPKIIATFTVELDEHGNCIQKVEGPFPTKDLYLSLSLTTANIIQQLQVAQMQAMQAAQQKSNRRILMPDGTIPPPGI